MHTRALATLKMQRVKTQLQKSKRAQNSKVSQPAFDIPHLDPPPLPFCISSVRCTHAT